MYVEPAADPSASCGPEDPSEAPSAAPPAPRRHRSSGEELEEGEIEDEDEEEQAEHHWTGEEYWAERRRTQAAVAQAERCQVRTGGGGSGFPNRHRSW